MKNSETHRLTFSFKETGEMLGVCSRTLRNLAASGAIKTIRIGRRRLIPESEVLRLVDVRKNEVGTS